MMQLLTLFKQQGCNLTFASAAGRTPYSGNLDELGVSTADIQLNHASFDEFISVLQPDMVLFDRFMTEEQYGWRVADQCPGALRVLDTEDLHGLRQARLIRHKRKLPAEQALTNETALREIASVYRCDVSLIISSYEMELLRSFFGVPESLLHYTPFMLAPPSDKDRAGWPSFEQRRHFISIGNFLHEPNRQAVLHLRQAIWPLIRKQLPGAEIHLYGAYPTPQILQLHCPAEGFMVKGRAAQAQEVVKQARVSLAPLLTGAGLKGKLAESMLCGTPSVTSSIGAEGMDPGSGWSGFICDTPEAFSEKAVQLYTDRELWLARQENGVHIIRTLFDREVHGEALVNKLVSVRQQLQRHRTGNFTGAMLQHHTLHSIRYMSRWIEAKNKLNNLPDNPHTSIN